MPAPRHPTHVDSRQHEQPVVALGNKLKSDYSYSQPATGLDISYEEHGHSSYQADESERAMGWNKRDMPIPRNVGNKVFAPAYDAENDTSNRIDSLFDAYADMYAEEGEDEDGAVADYYASSVHNEEEQEEEYDNPPQAREPWDQRGKNGLYGGGGRGADDQETGWVSNYGLTRDAGVEEDLRYDGQEEDQQARRQKRMDSQATQRDDRRRSSSDTEHSSYGPITPTNNSFSGPSGGPHIAQPESGYRSHDSPSSTKTKESHQVPHSKSSYVSGPPPMPQQQAAPTVVPTSPPMTLKKKVAPSPPKASGEPTPIVNPMQHIDTSLLNTTRRKPSAFGKWTGRGKKAPVISNPILPEGFVESLGMETFALTPGCAAPNHTFREASNTAPRTPNSDKGSSAGSVKSGGRKDAPRPRKIPGGRPNFLPALKLGEPVDLTTPISHPDGTSSLPRNESPLPTPVRLPLAALRNSSSGDEGHSSAYSHEISDAFRRLSRDSEVSYAPSSNTLASAEKTRRLYFNGIREDMARQHDTEVQANRAPVLANAPAIPAIPSRYADDVESPQQHTPTASGNRHGSTDSGFRNPWGPPGARNSGGSFGGRSLNHRGSKGSLPKGFTGEPRGSNTSGSTIHHHAAYNPSPFSAPIIEQPVIAEGPTREDRQGSTSSAYSEYSTVTDLADDSHPRVSSHDFPTTPSPPPTAPLYSSTGLAGNQPHRRGSLVPPSHQPPIAQTAPLKLRRQQNQQAELPSAQATTGARGEFNNWGHSTYEEPVQGGWAGQQQVQQPKEIGSTGFRNPFG